MLERHRKSIEILRQRAEAADGVIFFDVSDLDLEGYNKFIPYLLHPECVYSVSVSASAVRAKVSLGTNPWNQATADKNLASLAEKFGGGGHPRVSAISFDPSDIPRARQVARDLAAQLRAKCPRWRCELPRGTGNPAGANLQSRERKPSQDGPCYL